MLSCLPFDHFSKEIIGRGHGETYIFVITKVNTYIFVFLTLQMKTLHDYIINKQKKIQSRKKVKVKRIIQNTHGSLNIFFPSFSCIHVILNHNFSTVAVWPTAAVWSTAAAVALRVVVHLATSPRKRKKRFEVLIINLMKLKD